VGASSAGKAPVIYRYGAEPAQFGELWLPDEAAAGTVVVIHGGFWRALYDLSLGRPLAADLAARGYAAWNLEYRRALAGGGWPATAAGGRAGLVELSGDHFTLIDPASTDWAAAIAALPALLSLVGFPRGPVHRRVAPLT
jgi:hypothetical protein